MVRESFSCVFFFFFFAFLPLSLQSRCWSVAGFAVGLNPLALPPGRLVIAQMALKG